jgi:hypothetical protein
MNGTSQWLALGDNLIYDQSNLRPEEVIKWIPLYCDIDWNYLSIN